jgi:hypothetical protein
MHAVAVLLQYQGTLANIPKYLEPSIERSATLIAAYQPESDLIALVERYRTGPFRPEAHVYESISHDEFDVAFGIDLRKWAEGGWSGLTSGAPKKDMVPPVLPSLIMGLEDAYQRLANDTGLIILYSSSGTLSRADFSAERRKVWIYEVPLTAVHHLRETINSLPVDQPIPPHILAKFDAPVIASTLKLWALELNPPLASWEGWEEFRKLYPTGNLFFKVTSRIGDLSDTDLTQLGL